VADRGPEAWRETVPGLVHECADAWKLVVGPPYAAGAGGYVAPVDGPDLPPAVLKLIFPHRESRHEADALERWNGDGAVRLLARDDARWAMLIERCEPGTKLADAAVEDPLAVLVELLPRLWKATSSPFRSLTDEAAWWTSYLPRRWEEFGRPFDRRLLDAAIEALTSLAPTQGEQVLLHQDLHGANVLAAEREPWLVIDPKPLLGEREFGLAPIVRSSELGHSRIAVLGRLDRLTSDLGLDRDRARGWAIGQTVAWSFDPDCVEDHAETAGWLLAAR
jgi:streptomycin 6-kinase